MLGGMQIQPYFAALNVLTQSVPSGDPTSMTLIIGPPAYNTITDTTSGGNIIVSGAWATHANLITGTAQLRGIWSGYGNTIDAQIAANIFGCHHAAIEASTGGHSCLVGGSNHRTVTGGTGNFTAYAGVAFGQLCTVGGPSATCFGSELSNSIGSRTSVIGSNRCSIGMKLGTGVATSSTIANPVKGSVMTVTSTTTFGSVNDTGVTVVMDSVSMSGTVIKVPFTVTITSSTQLTITSNDTDLWYNKPNITNGALVYPTTSIASNGAQEAVIASLDSHITATTSANGNVIIGGNNSYIQDGTNNANGTLYPSWSIVFGSDCISQGPGQFVYGVGARPVNSGQSVRSYGNFANAGDRQVSQFFSGATTTDGTATGSTIPYGQTGALGQNYVLQPNKAYLLEAHVLAAQTAGTGGAGANVAGYRVNAVLTSSSAGVITIKSQTTTVLYEDQAAWDVTITKFDASGLGGAYTTNNQGIIKFTVTGDAARSARWFVDCKLVEVGYT